MTDEERIILIKKSHGFIVNQPPQKYRRIIEPLLEFDRWIKYNKAKLKKNLIKAKYLTLVKKNPKNKKDKLYDMIFTKDIGRVYRPSVKEWVEARKDHLVAKIENVEFDKIVETYDWIMGR